MAFSIRFGDFTLVGIYDWRLTSNYRVTEHYFPRRPGSIAPRVPAMGSKRVQLQGDLWKDSEAQVIAYFEDLGKKLSGGRERLYLRDDDYYLNATPEPFEHAFSANARPDVHSPYTLGFVIDDPFWYYPSQSTQQQTYGAVNTGTFAITNDGASRTPAVFQVTRTSAANDQADVIITHTTTGLFLKWTGTLPNGNSIIFDCVNRRVVALGGNGLGDFTGQIRLELEPGLNNFQYDGPGNVTIDIAWLKRWALH